MTLATARDALLAKVPRLGFGLTLATYDNGAATFTTTKARCMDGGVVTADGLFRGWYIYVPSAVAANRVRKILSRTVSATVATFTVDHTYTAGDTNVAGYMLRMDPDDLNTLLNDCLDNEFFIQTVAFTEVTDGDMQASGVTDWTDTSGTSSKVTAAANVPYGLPRAMQFANSGANGYTRSALTRITRGQSGYIWAICRADVGTAVLTLTDASGTTIDSISSTQEDWVFMYKKITPASTVEECYFRLGGSGASDISIWGGCGFLRPGARNIYLPSAVAKRVNLRGVSYADFHLAGDESGVYPAHSRTLHRLTEGPRADYRFIDEDKGANARAIELSANWTDYPLWLSLERKYSDVDTLTAEADTTGLDEQLHVERARLLLADQYPAEYGYLDVSAIRARDALRNQEKTDPEPERIRPFYGFMRGH